MSSFPTTGTEIVKTTTIRLCPPHVLGVSDVSSQGLSVYTGKVPVSFCLTILSDLDRGTTHLKFVRFTWNFVTTPLTVFVFCSSSLHLFTHHRRGVGGHVIWCHVWIYQYTVFRSLSKCSLDDPPLSFVHFLLWFRCIITDKVRSKGNTYI